MSKSFRRWGFVLGMLLFAILVGMFLLRPRPIRIPLSDGTTLTLSAITVGPFHTRPEPISWQAFRKQLARRKWGWPVDAVKMPEPCVMLWFEDSPGIDEKSLTLVDRHGWRWPLYTGFGSGGNYRACFPPIETDGTARIEVQAKDRLLGSAILPLPTALPIVKPDPLPVFPPVPVTPGEPAEVPIRRTEGPLEVTLRSFDIREHKGTLTVFEGRFQLETLWNGRPIVPEITLLAITDRFGRRAMLVPEPMSPVMIPLPAQGAIWDLHFRIFRSPDVPLDPEEVVVVTPKVEDGKMLFQQEDANPGREWRLTFLPSGTASLPDRFTAGTHLFQEDVPVIVVEFDLRRSLRIRLETLDAEGEHFPATRISNLHGPNIFAFRSPEFDAAKGHTIRIGFDESRLVQFTLRPEAVSKDVAEPQAGP